MRAEEARSVLAGYRAGQPADGKVQKALRLLEGDEALGRAFREQSAFDNQVFAWIQTIKPPPGLLHRINDAAAEPVRPRIDKAILKQPPVIAALIGLVVMLGFLIFFWFDHMGSFPGRDAVFRMIGVTQQMSGVELEPLITECEKLGDWLYLKYGLEDFNAPPEFSGKKTVGCRVYKQDGCPVAQVALEEATGAEGMEGSGVILYMFRASDFGVKLSAPKSWLIFEQEDWVAALRGESICSMVAFRGTRSQMRDYLASLAK